MKNMFVRLVIAGVTLSFGHAQAMPVTAHLISGAPVTDQTSLFFTVTPMINCPEPLFLNPDQPALRYSMKLFDVQPPDYFPQEVIMSGMVRKGKNFLRESEDNIVGASKVTISVSANITSQEGKNILHFMFADHVRRKDPRGRGNHYYNYDHNIEQHIDISDGKDKLVPMFGCYLVRIAGIKHGLRG